VSFFVEFCRRFLVEFVFVIYTIVLGGILMNWPIIFQGISSLSVIAALIGAVITVRKYIYEKNRDIYIRRLNEVYAPLYGLIMKQEKFREIYIPNVPLEKAPILTSKTRTVKQTIDFSSGTITNTSEEKTAKGLLDRKAFLEVLNDTNKGLARPQLLKLIYEYDLILYMEENTEEGSEYWEKATTEKVNIEQALVKEIIDGYEETIYKLGLDKQEKRINKYFKGNSIIYKIMTVAILVYVPFCLLFVWNVFDWSSQTLAERTITGAGFLFTILGTWYGLIGVYRDKK
jgi:hypothetical protein